MQPLTLPIFPDGSLQSVTVVPEKKGPILCFFITSLSCILSAGKQMVLEIGPFVMSQRVTRPAPSRWICFQHLACLLFAVSEGLFVVASF